MSCGVVPEAGCVSTTEVEQEVAPGPCQGVAGVGGS